ncbi:MAG: F0F1 ATP synthase subunit B [Armatimonadota bacterium]
MLDINPIAVLTQAIAFILLVLILGKFAFGPIGSVIETRQREIESTLDQVAADRRAMEQTRADYEQRLANIEAEAREHIAGAVRQAQEEAAAIVGKAKEEAAVQRDRALADIEQERKKAIVEIRSEMADLAVLAASKVLEREINPAVHRELIGDFINEVGARA